MQATTKSVVIGHATVDKITTTWPVAVFGKRDNARHHANYATMAVRSADEHSLKSLDPQAAVGKDGKVVTTAWYTVVTIPNEPAFDAGDTESPAGT